jgi:hypothetical protein
MNGDLILKTRLVKKLNFSKTNQLHLKKIEKEKSVSEQDEQKGEEKSNSSKETNRM